MQTSQYAVAYSRDPIAADAEGLPHPAVQLKMIKERYEDFKYLRMHRLADITEELCQC